ncbi:hypothetical protein [Antarcticimicrobium sediminis]|uniref:PsiF repeat-containing protein n=1 Tax=Antarcticimicrobium sediminis TaxID=2546227 RepID=A0A4R5EU38_9RHOB|nr:hypothetical protein [Antarcticimicrobium sediminis]TDE38302.1 hypothetical protein E1B25_09245 [Antarcticimicrobium sediminis]
MIRFPLLLAPLFAVLITATTAQAGEREETCRAQAEQSSGYRPRAIEAEAGGIKFSLSGSVALGVSRSSGAATPAAPPFAGAAHRERFEAKRNQKRAESFQRAFDACMDERKD